MKKKLFDLEDLYRFYEAKKEDVHFSADDEDSVLIVQEYGELNFNEDDYDPSDGLVPVTLHAFSDGINKNNTSVPDDALIQANASFANRPILAHIVDITDEDGNTEKDFSGHDMEFDDDGNVEYIEKPVGTVPESCNAHIEHSDKYNKDFCVVNGYLYDDYGADAVEILRNREDHRADVSVEIAVDELSYSVKENVLVINKFHYRGVTLLGRRQLSDGTVVKVNPAVEGANIQLTDFSAENNSIVNMADDSHVTTHKEESTKGGITEVGENKVQSTQDNPGVVAPAVDEYEIKFTVNDKEYSVSLNEKIHALYELVNNTYADADNTWYSVIVYDNEVVMNDFWNERYYRQNYKDEDGNLSLVGDRVSVHPVYVTDEEGKELDNIRSNYDELSSKYQAANDELEKYHTEPDKMNILTSDAYSVVTDNEDFKKLIEDHFDYSVDEVREKADAILLNAVKNKSIKYSNEPKNIKNSIKPIPRVTKRMRRYGNLVSKTKED